MKKKLRKTWPRIRCVRIKGETFYRVDARRKGTDGKQETFKVLKDAETRANTIEKDFAENGTDGLKFSAEDRGRARDAMNLLAPYGKTILQAAEFYKAYLDEVKRKEQSALVSVIADEWLKDKKSGRSRKLRQETIRGIEQAKGLLVSQFGTKRMLEVTSSDIRAYLDRNKVGLRRKFNINSRLSQFFNWSIKKGYTASNPCSPIDIHVEGKDVSILTPKEAFELLALCRSKYPTLLLYHAISLFAGLRPDECLALEWANVHLDEKAITVLAATSKTKETRTVPIEPVLAQWLESYKPQKLSGFVTPHKNFKKRTLALHVQLGFRGKGENMEAPEWPQDVLRHSYGSYWLVKYRNRAQLAEYMGNSLQIIKKHYKRVVSKSACDEFWRITPDYDGQGIRVTLPPTEEEITNARMKRIRKVISDSQGL